MTSIFASEKYYLSQHDITCRRPRRKRSPDSPDQTPIQPIPTPLTFQSSGGAIVDGHLHLRPKKAGLLGRHLRRLYAGLSSVVGLSFVVGGAAVSTGVSTAPGPGLALVARASSGSGGGHLFSPEALSDGLSMRAASWTPRFGFVIMWPVDETWASLVVRSSAKGIP